MPRADIAILTVIPEEYEAMVTCLGSFGCKTDHDPGSSTAPNQYGWVTGELRSASDQVYRLVVGIVVQPGPGRMASAVGATIARYKPQYVLLVGIAGGFPQDGLTRGDVVISTAIYDYEYGKVAADFQPRMDFTYQTDQTLLTSAISLHVRDKSWSLRDRHLRPDGGDAAPKLLQGAVASGGKVVDNAGNEFFAAVLKAWPRLLAVEMEGAGAAAAIETAKGAKQNVGFLMVRGISDMPKTGEDALPTAVPAEGNKLERDKWKKSAATTAANFTVHWISQAWPIAPRPTRRAPSDSEDADDDDPPGGKRPSSAPVIDAHLPPGPPSTIKAALSDSLGSLPVTADLARVTPDLLRLLLAAAVGQMERAGHAGPSSLDTELEAIKGAIDRHQIEVAEARLDDLELRSPDKLQPAQWYQLKVLRSRIHSARWEWEKAGRAFLDAKRHMPTTERARINEALGYELLGDRQRAHDLAAGLRAEFPHSARLVTIWARTAPASVPFAEVVAAAGPFLKDDEELNLAVAQRALMENRFDEALPIARKATELDADSPHAWFVLGEAKHCAGHRLGGDARNARLREAEAHYDRAIELARTQKMPGLEAAIRFNRGKVRHLRDDRRAEADFLTAIELGRPDQGMRTEYAGLMVEMGRYEDALRELAAEQEEPTGPRRFYEAAARYERNVGDDRRRADALLREVLASGTCERWEDAHILLVQWATDNKTQAQARTAIEATPLRTSHPLVYHTLRGWLAQSEGGVETAKAEFREALKGPTESASREHLFLLAQALLSVREDGLALPLLERCYRPGILNAECRALLDCARSLERHEVSIRVCRELRQAGVVEPRAVEREVSLLQMYDPSAALEVAQQYLARHPQDRMVTLWLSTLALRLDRRDLLVADLGRLPAVKDVTPQGAGLVINVLREAGNNAAALGYAYEALRAQFDQDFAHGQFLAHFLELSKSLPDLRVSGAVAPGMAVGYREGHEEVDRWVVIEDSPSPDLARGELGPDHPMSVALIGHEPGESVVVSDSGIQQRAVTIREVCHKFVHRFRDCLNQYQIRFPGGSAIQLMHVGSGDEFDPTLILKGLKGRKESIHRLDEVYRRGTLPFATYADLAGSGEFAVWGHLVSDHTLGIRCFDGRSDGLREGMDLARAAKTLVLDLTALITLAQLDLLRLLTGSPRTLVVSRATFDRIQHLVERAEDTTPSEGSIHLADDDQFEMVRADPDQRERYVAFLARLRDAVRDHCEIRPCPQAASLAPDKRRQITQALGRHNLESLLLAGGDGVALWSDDLVVGILGRVDFQARRVWTQALLFVLRQEGAISQQDFDQAVARLVGWHYHGIIFNEETVLAAAELAEWQMDRWPVPAFRRSLGDDEGDPIMRLRIVAQSIKSVWRRELPRETKAAFLFGLLAGLGSLRMIRRLYAAIPGLFSVDVFAADDVRTCISVWLRHPTCILRP
jgi:nucleoside phosphorylase/tetratricopeptide (TPR) repeat protein/transcription elongation GreA/GreB family factor